MHLLSFFKLKDKDGELLEDLEVCDEYAREHIPTKTSQLENDSNFIESSDLAAVALSGDYDDLSNKPTIPTKTSQLENDSNFVESSDLAAVATSGDYDDLTDKPTIPVVSSVYDNPFNKVRLNAKGIVYGSTASQSVNINSQYVANQAYFADVSIDIPENARLTALANVIVQTVNGLGLVSVDIISQTTSRITVRIFSPKSETVTLQFSVLMFGDY